MTHTTALADWAAFLSLGISVHAAIATAALLDLLTVSPKVATR